MGALTVEEVDAVISSGSELALWREDFRRVVAARARAHGHRARVHVKYDTGMGRLGNPDPGEVLELCRACAEDPDLELAGVWTHLATADELDSGYFDEQFEPLRRGRRRGQGRAPRCDRSTPPTAPPSCATSAPTTTWPAAGSRSTGSTRSSATPPSTACDPRFRCVSHVADVKRFPAGASAGYGRRWKADGRHLGRGRSRSATATASAAVSTNNAEVLVGGQRYPLVGTVSMDNITSTSARRPTSSPATKRC